MVDFTTIIIIYLIIILLWLPQAVYQILTWTYWWQIKEYRFDRFWVFLKTSYGREKLGLYSICLKFLALILGVFYLPIPFFIFAFQDILFLRNVFLRRVRIPVVTERVEKIFVTSFFAMVITIFVLLDPRKVLGSLLFGEMLLLITPYVGILWTIPIVNKTKRKEIEKAKKVLSLVNPTVVGITGSYGKTTTKEFVAHLLSQKYTTAKTEGSENTEFGIARKTFKNVVKGTKFFVVEMGAYKAGEIKKLAGIVRPTIGIITGIEEQHLSLFGSLENIKKAKFELIESLPKGGVAIFNYSNKYCRELAGWATKLPTKLEVLGYYVKNKGNKEDINTDIFSEVLSVNREKISFKVALGEEQKKLSANLPGLHFLENLTCAVLVAKFLGVSWKDIEKGCKSIAVPENTMDVYKLKSGSIIIDDTHNSTPLAFESALKYLSYFKDKKKVVITSGIIELGVTSESVHERIGNIMSENIDKIILTNSDFYESIKSGLGDKSNRLILGNDRSLDSEIAKIITSEKSVILLEGRLPTIILEVIQKQK